MSQRNNIVLLGNDSFSSQLSSASIHDDNETSAYDLDESLKYEVEILQPIDFKHEDSEFEEQFRYVIVLL